MKVEGLRYSFQHNLLQHSTLNTQLAESHRLTQFPNKQNAEKNLENILAQVLTALSLPAILGQLMDVDW
ncbi:MAG: hypothetical protein Q7N50_10470 [Armatimonadota bacterium]|nr:hypothetical protein [Armatimonadota bacterium]